MVEFGKITPIRLQSYLAGASYPTKKNDLLDCAKENGAPKDVLELIEALPARSFVSPADLSRAVGELPAK
jgi:hypothetical protein